MIELSLILIRMLIDINSGPANAIGATFLAPAKNSTGIPGMCFVDVFMSSLRTTSSPKKPSLSSTHPDVHDILIH